MTTRREFVQATIAALGALGVPHELWALQSGEELVRFTDYTDDFKVEAQAANPTVRCMDLRTLTSWATPNEDFFAFHQTVTPKVDAATFRLRVGGLVERPRELPLAEIMARPDARDESVTLECSGNSTRPTRMGGLLSNGVWRGVPLAAVLKECGIKPEAREVVFLGADLEKEKKFQAGNREYTAPHGRSVFVQDALNPDALLAFQLNGQPLPPKNGFPLRLILPGWYGMTQIKWLSRIEVIDRRYEGQHQVRNYLSLRAVDTPEGPIWLDQSISKTHRSRWWHAWCVAGVRRAGRIESPDRRGAGRRRSTASRSGSTTARGSRRSSIRRRAGMRGVSGPSRWTTSPRGRTPSCRGRSTRRERLNRSPRSDARASRAGAKTTPSGCVRFW